MGLRQATLWTGQLDPSQDLLARFVAAQLRSGGFAPRGVRELNDPGLELGQGPLERVEALALDARVGPDGEGPGGGYFRWSIGM